MICAYIRSLPSSCRTESWQVSVGPIILCRDAVPNKIKTCSCQGDATELLWNPIEGLH